MWFLTPGGIPEFLSPAVLIESGPRDSGFGSPICGVGKMAPNWNPSLGAKEHFA